MLCCSSLVFAGQESAAQILEKIPVQHNGRIKPFQSFAQETVFYLTGKRKLAGVPATQAVWQWIADPEKWNSEPFLPVPYKALKDEWGLMLVNGKISPELVLNHRPFVERVQQATEARRKKAKLSLLDQKRLELFEKASVFRAVGTGEIPGWLAHPEHIKEGWIPFRELLAPDSAAFLTPLFPEKQILNLKESLQHFLAAFSSGPATAEAGEAAARFSSALKESFVSRGIVLDEKVIQAEICYNHLHPFGLAWKFYGLAVLVGLMAIVGAGFKPAPTMKINPGTAVFSILFTLGFLIHTYGFYLRCVIAGRPPVSNMYESIIWVSWAVVFFASLLFAAHRALLIPVVASSVAAFALILAEGFPTVLDPSIAPLVPVLRSNLWLTVHVLTITLSYGAFALAWGLGHVTAFSYAFQPGKTEKNRALSQYLYRALQIGVLLLALGTVLGGVWANYSWGRFWGWDPKETWALIALLGYLAVLHGRFAGWLSHFGMAVGSVVAFLGVVMAWYGVNYVLAAGLHSYGFGGGGALYVLAVAILDLAVVTWSVYVYNFKCQNSNDKLIQQ